eukprot:8359014-Prorocentrum_lima.AAC.1
MRQQNSYLAARAARLRGQPARPQPPCSRPRSPLLPFPLRVSCRLSAAGARLILAERDQSDLPP